MKLETLKKIGLTEGEIKVYQALLELGECTKTNLSKTSGISPSNIYDVTNRLIEKGIISQVKKNGIIHFSPANPKHLLYFLDHKKKEIDQEKDLINQILPSLMAEFQKIKETVNVEVFQGWKGMKTIFDDLIDECNKGDKNYIFGANKGESAKTADAFFLKYSKLRAKKGIITNIIFNQELRKRKERIDFFLKSKNYNVKFIDQFTPAEVMFYKYKCCILILTKEPLIIRITSKEVTQSFKEHFEIMWNTAKS